MTTPITASGPIRATITQIEIGELWRPKFVLSQNPNYTLEVTGFRQFGQAVFVEYRYQLSGAITMDSADHFVQHCEPILEP